jgi:hypothetical protein
MGNQRLRFGKTARGSQGYTEKIIQTVLDPDKKYYNGFYNKRE